MKGVYILMMSLKKDIVIKVGSLGRINFNKGKYVYVGSAQRALEKRIIRHLKRRKKKFWHIDYLLANPNVSIDKIMYREGGKDQECKIACVLAMFEQPIKGFGSSDCKCESHLFRIKKLNIDKLKLKELKL